MNKPDPPWSTETVGLYEELHLVLLQSAIRLLQDPDRAAQAVVTAFDRYQQSRESAPGRPKETALLHAMVINAARTMLRHDTGDPPSAEPPGYSPKD